MTSSSKRLKIAIIGAGPAGCTLARLLIHNDVLAEVTIFEGDKSIDARSQGGSLDLHKESGLEAMKRCGLYEEYLKYARFDGEAFTVANKDLKKLICMAGTDEKSSRGRPEIDRVRLREILVDSLAEGVIRWGWHLKSVVEVGDGSFNLLFRDQGLESGFDLVVGAEGAWSKVRAFLSDDRPYFFGVSGVSLSISDPQNRCPDLYKLVNRGSMFAFSDAKSIMAQQLGDGSLSVGTWGAHAEDYIQKFDDKAQADTETIKALLRKEYEGWNPLLLQIFEMADGPVVPRNLHMLPIGTKWKHRPGITMIGDAAHLMGPFAGEGVNLAMSDAMSLATTISNASKPSLDVDTKSLFSTAIRAFEEDMFKRATKVQQMSYDMMEAMFMTPGAPNHTIEKWLLTAAGKDMNFILKGLLAVAVYTYFFFWRCWNL
ncbi:hypothetical protein E6O75_ATG04905 [Venturia nashicola]|uniref:FAD-binding domain-containing protein n=1 Tax=Venturia nashicola TaxID=86259 RepID=A0A4Z1P198_9PEZI|nr:hypothetical protein E6O75_ATG04905 [Venturia nashicola]